MTRGHTVAQAFVEIHLIPGILGLDDSTIAGEPIVWSGVAATIRLGDLALQLQEPWRTRTQTASQFKRTGVSGPAARAARNR